MTPGLHPVLDEHRQALRATFVELLVAQHPIEVLDLGAGDGAMVEELAQRGIDARGIEQSGEALERAQSLGRPIVEGSLDGACGRIPSAPWVTLRHVLHHLPDPKHALLCAESAAYKGIVVAEPICTTGLPMHEWTQRLEGLTRRLDRESGMIHGRDFTPAELVSMLPAAWPKDVHIHAPMTPLPAEEAEALIARAARGSALSVDDEAEARLILSAAAEGRLAPAGSVMVMATAPR